MKLFKIPFLCSQFHDTVYDFITQYKIILRCSQFRNTFQNFIKRFTISRHY